MHIKVLVSNQSKISFIHWRNFHKGRYISEGCQIVVGTPGRVLDMINKKILPLTELKLFIIDEIDEAFERGFLDIIKTITSLLSDTCQCD